MLYFKDNNLSNWIASHKKTSIILLFLSSIIISIFLATYLYLNFFYYRLPQNTIFLSLPLGGMNRCQVKNEIDKKINPLLKNFDLDLNFQGNSYKINTKNFNFHFKSKNVFNSYLKNKLNSNETLHITVNYNENELKKELEKLSSSILVNPTSYSSHIQDDKLIVCSGKPGNKIDVYNSTSKIVDSVSNFNFNPINLSTLEFSDDNVPINIDDIYKNTVKSVKNASYSIDDNGNLTYDDEQNGLDFDLNLAKSIISDRFSGTYEIPLSITKPATTVKELKREHDLASCPSLISTYTTKFPTGPNYENRNYNIAKAALAINNTVLYPKEAFSSIKSIGPANYSQGYKESTVYTPDGPTNGVGGGICQVSTTTYLAAIYGYMDILERHPHSFTVGYVPLGYDAAFSSPSTDMKFKNNRDNPIKIYAFVGPSSLTVSIFGTHSDLDNYKVTLKSSISQTIPPNTKEKQSNELPLGTTKVDTQGQNGYLVNTKKTVIKAGKIIAESNIESYYKPVTKVVLIGTNDSLNLPDPNKQ